MGGENQTEALLANLVLEFSKGELIERQQEALFSRHFDFDRASVRIARPTFGCFVLMDLSGLMTMTRTFQATEIVGGTTTKRSM